MAMTMTMTKTLEDAIAGDCKTARATVLYSLSLSLCRFGFVFVGVDANAVVANPASDILTTMTKNRKAFSFPPPLSVDPRKLTLFCKI